MVSALLLALPRGSGDDVVRRGPVVVPADARAIEEERALVTRVRAGDGAAYATLVERYLEPVTRVAHAIVGSRDAAEDVVQGVFVQLWEQRTTLDPARAIKPYLYRAVRNRALNERKADLVRERYRADVQSETVSGARAATTPALDDVVLTEADVTVALEQLSERRRLAVRLRFEGQLTHAEIGEMMGISPAAAMQLVLRAIDELRGILRI